MRKTIERELPPAYSILHPDHSAAIEIERRWDSTVNDPSLCGCRQKCTDQTCTKFPYIWFGFQSKARQPETGLMSILGRRRNRPVWRAVFQIWNRNVARSMREGFSWKPENLHIGQDTITLNTAGGYSTSFPPPETEVQIQVMLSQIFAASWGKTANDTRWPHVRKYTFSNNPAANVSEHCWSGHLLVFSDEPSVLINFDIKSITTDLTAWGWAVDSHGETVFDTRGGSDQSYNTIFPGNLHWWSCPGDS
jgi:hypothetical protein